MTAKEKAKQLVDNMHAWQSLSIQLNYPNTAFAQAKQCALIAVDEILKELDCAYNGEPITSNEHKEYWQDVKTEIEKL